MPIPQMGELAALGTACAWTVSVMMFEAAGRRIGSLSVNMIRLGVGLLFLAIFGWVTRGLFWPTDATWHNWFWLSLSGVVGLTLGDVCLFKAFVLVGSRISVLIMSFVPVISALVSWVVLGETLEPLDISGMVLTVAGVAAVVSRKRTDHNGRAWAYPLRGIWLAFGGAAGQAIGFVLSKHGMGAYDAFAANQIRLIAGLVGFVIIFSVTGWWPKLFQALGHRSGIVFTSIGGFFGPFLGISLSLYAVQHTQVGVAATIIALVPVLIIPPSILIKKEAVTLREIIGALVAVGGSALLFR